MLSRHQMPLSLRNHRPSGAIPSLCTLPALTYRYGEKEWLAKAGCQRTTRKSCNLTLETGNLTELYYAQVTAVSPGGKGVKKSGRFSSLQHSKGGCLLTSGAGRSMSQGGARLTCTSGGCREDGLCAFGVKREFSDLPEWMGTRQVSGFQRRSSRARAHPRRCFFSLPLLRTS